jgi:hypothetical protein
MGNDIVFSIQVCAETLVSLIRCGPCADGVRPLSA